MAVLKYYDGSDWEPVVSALQGPTGATGVTGATGPTGANVGKILQVVQTYYKTIETINSSTFAATGISASITPTSASSKILVMVNIVASSQTDSYGGFRLYRNDSEVTGANSDEATGSNKNLFINYAHRDADAAYESDTFCQNYLDSPASTASQAYTIYWAKLYGGIMQINGPYQVDTGNTYINFAPSSITLMEVGG
jgi:hypothetical protein